MKKWLAYIPTVSTTQDLFTGCWTYGDWLALDWPEGYVHENIELSKRGRSKDDLICSACALENMMIAANALDLGSCWINQLHWLDENEAIRTFMRPYGLEDNETITGGLILGYADTGLPNRTPLIRTGSPVTWVE